MTDLINRYSEDLQLKGMSKVTIKMYTRAVRQLTKHYQKSPQEILTKNFVNISSTTKTFGNGPESLLQSLFAALNIFLH